MTTITIDTKRNQRTGDLTLTCITLNKAILRRLTDLLERSAAFSINNPKMTILENRNNTLTVTLFTDVESAITYSEVVQDLDLDIDEITTAHKFMQDEINLLQNKITEIRNELSKIDKTKINMDELHTNLEDPRWACWTLINSEILSIETEIKNLRDTYLNNYRLTNTQHNFIRQELNLGYWN